MSKSINITGKKFGKLTALYSLHNHNTKDGMCWLCICDCGNFKEASSILLRKGTTKSCGCLLKKGNPTHGKCNTRLHTIWDKMKARCYNKNSTAYKNYGGRGIKVCQEWLDDFMNFYNWSMNNGYQEGLTIDRIDSDSSYEPNNCRWTDRKTQNRNRRNTKYVTYRGETKPLAEWCEILDLKYYTVRARIYKYNWPIEKALEVK